jgi:pimeloyl-ACP methyl ester carboxylesterase
VAAGARAGLEYRDLVDAVQQVGGDEAGHPCADDRDSHAHYSYVQRRPDHALVITGTRLGAGPLLVLLHTLGTDHRMWDPVVGRLAAEREVLALDLPGFGGSPPVDGGAPAALAGAIGSWLDAQGIERPHLAGNSLGGWVALELALAGRAASVTAIAPAGLWSAPLAPRRSRARAAARAALPLAGLIARWPATRRLALAGTAAHPERIPPADARRLIRAYATAPGFDEANDAMRAGTFTALDRIAVPVTLAWPDGDRLVARPRHLPPAVRSVVLHGCGHLPTWDDPAQVARVLLDGSA